MMKFRDIELQLIKAIFIGDILGYHNSKKELHQ